MSAHQGAVAGVEFRIYGLQLVQHLTDDDDARPHGADAGGDGPDLGEGQGESPGRQEHRVEEGHLPGRHKTTPAHTHTIFMSVNHTGLYRSWPINHASIDMMEEREKEKKGKEKGR